MFLVRVGMWQYRLSWTDLLFLVDTVMPGRPDREKVARAIRGDTALLEQLLDDERVFQRVVREKELVVELSPWLYFTILLRRVTRELAQEAFTVELRSRQKVILFDTEKVVELLQDEAIRDYLAQMLASFTRVESVTIRMRVRRGVWYRVRASELDVENMIRYAESLEPAFRYGAYRRIGEVCLFLAGVFPEHIDPSRRYPAQQLARWRARSQLLTRLEDYESHGQAFYRLASEHEQARVEGMDTLLRTLAEDFIFAEKALNVLTQRHLQLARHELFQM
ncbi:MAG: hypothetical protein H5T60_08080 [Anaerolineae bacterium]|nr:hypothetical protein [Anaerolineae bacterium]